MDAVYAWLVGWFNVSYLFIYLVRIREVCG